MAEKPEYIITEGPDGIRIGMSVDTFRDHYQDAGYKAVASVGDDGKEHPHANIVSELNKVQKSSTGATRDENTDTGTTTNTGAENAPQTATTENTD